MYRVGALRINYQRYAATCTITLFIIILSTSATNSHQLYNIEKASISINADGVYNASMVIELNIPHEYKEYTYTFQYSIDKIVTSVNLSSIRELSYMNHKALLDKSNDLITYNEHYYTSKLNISREITIKEKHTDKYILRRACINISTTDNKYYLYYQLLITEIILKYNLTNKQVKVSKETMNNHYILSIDIGNTSLTQPMLNDTSIKQLFSDILVRALLIHASMYRLYEEEHGKTYIYYEEVEASLIIPRETLTGLFKVIVFKDPDSNLTLQIGCSSRVLISNVKVYTTLNNSEYVSWINVTGTGIGENKESVIKNILRCYQRLFNTTTVTVYGRGVLFRYGDKYSSSIILQPGTNVDDIEVLLGTQSTSTSQEDIWSTLYWVLLGVLTFLIIYYLYRARLRHR